MKRWFLLALFVTACSHQKAANEPTTAIDRAKLEPLYRSAKAIDAAVSVALNNSKMRELVQAAATELSIAKDKGKTPEEHRIVELFGDALVAYKDSLDLWDAKLASSGRFVIPCSGQTTVRTIALRYDLPCAEWKGLPDHAIPEESIQYVWAIAGMRLRAANARYLDDPKLEDARDMSAIKRDMYAVLAAMENENRRQAAASARELAAFRRELRRTRNRDIVFYANSDDGHYHTLDCLSVMIPRRVTTVGEADAKGYKPCTRCNAPKPIGP